MSVERLRHNKEFLEIKVELDNARKEIAELKNRLNSK